MVESGSDWPKVSDVQSYSAELRESAADIWDREQRHR